MGRIISYAIFGVMLVGALSYMVYDNIRFSGTSSWRSVPGSILESEVTTSSGGRGARTTYHPRVTYAYAVDGRSFTGDEIWLTAGTMFDTAEDARAFLAPYRVGSRVTVWYDPTDPSDTALIVERGGDPMVLLILAGLWGLIGTYHWPRDRPSGAGTGDSPVPAQETVSAAAGVPLRPRAGCAVIAGQMAAAFVLVAIAFIIYVIATGPDAPNP